jgi:hypothetical protein
MILATFSALIKTSSRQGNEMMQPASQNMISSRRENKLEAQLESNK